MVEIKESTVARLDAKPGIVRLVCQTPGCGCVVRIPVGWLNSSRYARGRCPRCYGKMKPEKQVI